MKRAMLCLAFTAGFILGLLPGKLSTRAERISITTADDLIRLQQNCSYDAWSRDKEIVLENDISLSGVEDFVIPTFGGSFDGQGYRITELSVTGNLSPAGLFGELQEGAVVHDLKVEGSIAPEGNARSTGGIAGINRGVIRDCTFYGSVSGTLSTGGIAGRNETAGRIEGGSMNGAVFGKSMTGGIAGYNGGTVYFSTGNAYVNTRALDPGLSLSDIDTSFHFLADLNRALSSDTYNVTSDTGGIAGYSDGVIIGAMNNGTVGYQHLGYNVGGVAGRSRGLISGAKNNGPVYGRKDIGGIVGMAEPYVSADETKDRIDEIQDELHHLNGIVDQAASDARDTNQAVYQQLSSMNQFLTEASHHTNALASGLRDYADDTIDEVNEGSDLLQDTIRQTGDVLDNLEDAMDEVGDAAGTLRSAVSTLESTYSTADFSAAFQKLRSAEEDLSRAAAIREAARADIREGREALKQAESLTAAAEALSRIGAGISISLHGRGAESGDSDGMVYYLLQAMTELDGLDNDPALPESVKRDISNTLSSLRRSSRDLSSGLSDAASLTEDLGSRDSLHFNEMSPDVTESSDALYQSMLSITSQMDALNQIAHTDAGALTDDIREMNESLQKVMDLMIDQVNDIEDASEKDLIEDTSDADIGQVINGKVFLCRNQGPVEGDIDVGGIAGAMAIYDELDPEDDRVRKLSDLYHKRYELKLVLQSNVNSGVISAKKSYAGGICGFAQLGVIWKCTDSGEITIEDGDYVGGIAGYADNIIRSCYEKSTLSGRKYIGGIVGAGTLSITDGLNREDTDANLRVESCVAIPKITGSDGYAGAVAGADIGSFTDNVFVADDLAGINRVSIAGQADPVSYQALMEGELAADLPAELKSFRLRFVADGREVKSESFHYGASFDADAFPEIPAREGCFARWDQDALTDLHHDVTVEAVYTPYVTAVASIPTRNASRPVFFVQGSFDDAAVLLAEPSVYDFTLARGGILETLLHYNQEISEQWELILPEDGTDTHTVRYLPPSTRSSGISIYLQRGDGSWVQPETASEGSYISFPVEGSHARMTVLSYRTVWWIWAVLGGLLLLILLLIARDIYVRRTAGGSTATLTGEPAEDLQTESKSSAAPAVSGTSEDQQTKSQQTDADRSNTEKSEEALHLENEQNHRKEEEKKNRKEKEERKVKKAKKRRQKPPLRVRLRRHLIALLALSLALAAAVGIFIARAPGIRDGMGLYLLMRNYFGRSDLEMNVDLRADFGTEHFDTSIDFYMVSGGEKQITCVDWLDTPIYYCDGMMILENGRAYRIGSGLPDYGSIADLVLPLFSSVEVSTNELNGVRTYHAEAENEAAEKILKTMMPGVSDLLPETNQVHVDLVTTDTELSSVSFDWDGVLQGQRFAENAGGAGSTAQSDAENEFGEQGIGAADENRSMAGGSPASLHAVLRFRSTTTQHTAPQMVLSAIKNADLSDIREMDEDVGRLVISFSELAARKPLSAEVKVQASCGPFVVNDAFSLGRTRVNGTQVLQVGRGDTVFYIADGNVCTENGLMAKAGGGYLENPHRLFELGVKTFLRGEGSVTVDGSAHTYAVPMDDEEMQTLASLLVPEAENMSMQLEKGSVIVTVQDQDTRLTALDFKLSGTTNVAAMEVPVSMTAGFQFLKRDEDLAVPEPVLEKLGIAVTESE